MRREWSADILSTKRADGNKQLSLSRTNGGEDVRAPFTLLIMSSLHLNKSVKITAKLYLLRQIMTLNCTDVRRQSQKT